MAETKEQQQGGRKAAFMPTMLDMGMKARLVGQVGNVWSFPAKDDKGVPTGEIVQGMNVMYFGGNMTLMMDIDRYGEVEQLLHSGDWVEAHALLVGSRDGKGFKLGDRWDIHAVNGVPFEQWREDALNRLGSRASA